LEQITDRAWHIQYILFYIARITVFFYRASNAIEGSGVADGINWLSEIIKRNKK
jgi:hypothetical protein